MKTYTKIAHVTSHGKCVVCGYGRTKVEFEDWVVDLEVPEGSPPNAFYLCDIRAYSEIWCLCVGFRSSGDRKSS